MEGFVVRFEDGQMLKIKTHWYFGINHSLDDIKNPRNERHKWECILNEKYDDIRAYLNAEERDRFVCIRVRVRHLSSSLLLLYLVWIDLQRIY